MSEGEWVIHRGRIQNLLRGISNSLKGKPESFGGGIWNTLRGSGIHGRENQNPLSGNPKSKIHWAGIQNPPRGNPEFPLRKDLESTDRESEIHRGGILSSLRGIVLCKVFVRWSSLWFWDPRQEISHEEWLNFHSIVVNSKILKASVPLSWLAVSWLRNNKHGFNTT